MSDGLQPGDILAGRWEIQEAIGLAPDPDGECDAPDGGSYMMVDGSVRCRCVVCPRCRHHTGNAHQGHYWAFCKVLAERLRAELGDRQLLAGEFMRRATREFHFCCPLDPGCELEAAEAQP